jgi:hypothetical protein
MANEETETGERELRRMVLDGRDPLGQTLAVEIAGMDDLPDGAAVVAEWSIGADYDGGALIPHVLDLLAVLFARDPLSFASISVSPLLLSDAGEERAAFSYTIATEEEAYFAVLMPRDVDDPDDGSMLWALHTTPEELDHATDEDSDE